MLYSMQPFHSFLKAVLLPPEAAASISESRREKREKWKERKSFLPRYTSNKTKTDPVSQLLSLGKVTKIVLSWGDDGCILSCCCKNCGTMFCWSSRWTLMLFSYVWDEVSTPTGALKVVFKPLVVSGQLQALDGLFAHCSFHIGFIPFVWSTTSILLSWSIHIFIFWVPVPEPTNSQHTAAPFGSPESLNWLVPQPPVPYPSVPVSPEPTVPISSDTVSPVSLGPVPPVSVSQDSPVPGIPPSVTSVPVFFLIWSINIILLFWSIIICHSLLTSQQLYHFLSPQSYLVLPLQLSLLVPWPWIPIVIFCSAQCLQFLCL